MEDGFDFLGVNPSLMREMRWRRWYVAVEAEPLQLHDGLDQLRHGDGPQRQAVIAASPVRGAEAAALNCSEGLVGFGAAHGAILLLVGGADDRHEAGRVQRSIRRLTVRAGHARTRAVVMRPGKIGVLFAQPPLAAAG